MYHLFRSYSGALRIVVFVALCSASHAALAKDGHDNDTRLTGVWATSPAGLPPTPGSFNNQTLRLIVNPNGGGDHVRIEISNAFGTDPLVIGAAHVALRKAGASIVPGTDRSITFSGGSSFTIPPGGLVLSDAASLEVPALADVAVSIYLPSSTVENTTHLNALQTNYIAASTGDSTGAADLPGATALTRWPFLTGVEVTARGGGAIVALGDSITDGAGSTSDTNHRWPDYLANRLQASRDLKNLSVLNQGIIGNRILHATETQYGNLFGPAGLERFDRDVVAQPGARFVIVLLGINDIGHPGSSAPLTDYVSAHDIEAGYLQFIARAHAKGIRIYGCTLTPFENTTLTNFYSPDKEVERQAVNAWIRTSGAFDAVIDFEMAVRDPSHPTQILPAYDSGDHLHPNDAGKHAMANAIDLRLFRQ